MATSSEIEAWLETVKKGYGRFAPSFQKIGVEDLDDLKDGISEQTMCKLDVELERLECLPFQMDKIKKSLSRLSSAGEVVSNKLITAGSFTSGELSALEKQLPPGIRMIESGAISIEMFIARGGFASVYQGSCKFSPLFGWVSRILPSSVSLVQSKTKTEVSFNIQYSAPPTIFHSYRNGNFISRSSELRHFAS